MLYEKISDTKLREYEVVQNTNETIIDANDLLTQKRFMENEKLRQWEQYSETIKNHERAIDDINAKLALAKTYLVEPDVVLPPPPAPIPDVTPPQVFIQSPLELDVVSGMVTIQVIATDDIGIEDVNVEVDKNPLGTITAAPYTIGWDTSKEISGKHSIVAIARDMSGNITYSPARIVVV